MSRRAYAVETATTRASARSWAGHHRHRFAWDWCRHITGSPGSFSLCRTTILSGEVAAARLPVNLPESFGPVGRRRENDETVEVADMLLDFEREARQRALTIHGVLHVGAHLAEEATVYRALGIDR